MSNKSIATVADGHRYWQEFVPRWTIHEVMSDVRDESGSTSDSGKIAAVQRTHVEGQEPSYRKR